MPAEYVRCKESYIKKGISEKTASGRCAAMYFKRHNMTVNEAHKKGVASFPDLEGITEDDLKLAELILSDLEVIEDQTSAVKPDTHGEQLEITALNMDFLDEFGVLEIVATKVGAGAFTGNGQAVSWTEKALKKAAPTWLMGNVSVNHNGKYYGRIIASFFENGLVRMTVKVNEQLKGWLKKFGKDVGVSIEATSVKLNKKFDITDAKGTGVTFVFPPETPACDIKEGCGIVATEAKVGEPNITVNINAEDEEKSVDGIVSSTPINLLTYDPYGTGYTTTADSSTATITIVTPNNITEDNKNLSSKDIIETKKVETMAEEPKPETICAKKHESIVKEKDTAIEALKKELESLKATVSKYDAEKKCKLLEAIKNDGLDPKVYESKEISVLEDILATLEAFKKKEAEVPEVNSGAVITATVQETKKEGDIVTATLTEAEDKAKKEAEELARINAKASNMDGRTR